MRPSYLYNGNSSHCKTTPIYWIVAQGNSSAKIWPKRPVMLHWGPPGPCRPQVGPMLPQQNSISVDSTWLPYHLIMIIRKSRDLSIELFNMVISTVWVTVTINRSNHQPRWRRSKRWDKTIEDIWKTWPCAVPIWHWHVGVISHYVFQLWSCVIIQLGAKICTSTFSRSWS